MTTSDERDERPTIATLNERMGEFQPETWQELISNLGAEIWEDLGGFRITEGMALHDATVEKVRRRNRRAFFDLDASVSQAVIHAVEIGALVGFCLGATAPLVDMADFDAWAAKALAKAGLRPMAKENTESPA